MARAEAVIEMTEKTRAPVAGLIWREDVCLPDQAETADNIVETSTSGDGRVAVQIEHLITDAVRGKRHVADSNPIVVTDPDDPTIFAIQMPCAVSWARSGKSMRQHEDEPASANLIRQIRVSKSHPQHSAERPRCGRSITPC
jgi:hypothetical protein